MERALELTWQRTHTAGTQLLLRLTGGLDRRNFSKTGRHLARLLKRTSTTLQLRVEVLHRHERADLQRLLARLARWGDRVYIEINDKLRDAVPIDSSVFHLVLRREAAAV
ncbi:MAG: hypothetical protein ACLGHO_07065 [Gammaproteobacteria bacterium]